MAVQEKFDLVIRAQDEASGIIRRINDELASTTQSIAALNSAFAASAGASAPLHQVGAAFRNAGKGAREAAAGFSRAELKSALLGVSVAGLPPQIGGAVSAFAFGNPVIAATSLALGALSAVIVKQIAEFRTLSEVVGNHRSALSELAKSGGVFSGEAERLIGILQKQDRIELAALERTASLARAGRERVAIQNGLITTYAYSNINQERQNQILGETLPRIQQLRDSLIGVHNVMYGPTRDDFERFIAQEKQAAKDTEMLNKALREQANALQMLKQGNFRGIGSDVSLRGPGYFGVPQEEVDKAKQEAERAMESIWAIPEEETRMIADAQAQWMEFSSMVLSSTDQLASGITDMFFGLRDSLADVFKSMAANWIRYFINEILKQTALKLGFALFNVFFPGSGSVLAGAGALGGSDVPITSGLTKMMPSGGTGLDVISAGAKRFSGGGVSGASTTVIIQGDVIGDEQYVNKRIIPAIENAIRYQTTMIAGR